MPSGQRGWWEAFNYVPGYSGPDDHTLRPCGCHIDPVVFGHADHLRQAVAA